MMCESLNKFLTLGHKNLKTEVSYDMTTRLHAATALLSRGALCAIGDGRAIRRLPGAR